jgi:excisionase family DNA binding protein
LTHIDSRNRKSRKEKSTIIGKKVAKIMEVGLHMQSASYSTAEAARLLRVSIPTLKRMCETGDIPYFKTPGGHLRIPAEGLKSMQGKAGGSTTSTPSGVLQSRRERVEELNLEGQELRAQRELRKLRNEEAAETAQRRAEDEARQQQSQQRAQEAAQQQIARLNREAQERRERVELGQIAEFRQRWFQIAENKADGVDRLSAVQRKQLLEALEIEINRRTPADECRMETVLARTVKAVVEPWECEWRREQAEHAARQVKARVMERLLFQFPYEATDSEKTGALSAMQMALESLPANTPEPELVRGARQALDPVRQQVEKRLLSERVVQGAVGQLP